MRERQQTIPEVEEMLAEAVYEDLADPFWQDMPLSGNGSFAEAESLADEIFTSQVRQSVLEERITDAMRTLDIWFQDEVSYDVAFDYYDGSITFKDMPRGWEPTDRVRKFLFEFAGFSRIWVRYQGTLPDKTWSKPS